MERSKFPMTDHPLSGSGSSAIGKQIIGYREADQPQPTAPCRAAPRGPRWPCWPSWMRRSLPCARRTTTSWFILLSEEPLTEALALRLGDHLKEIEVEIAELEDRAPGTTQG